MCTCVSFLSLFLFFADWSLGTVRTAYLYICKKRVLSALNTMFSVSLSGLQMFLGRSVFLGRSARLASLALCVLEGRNQHVSSKKMSSELFGLTG